MKREEAIKEMREKLPWLTEDTKRLVEALVPELAESEDERIWKELVAFFKEMRDTWHEIYWHDLQVEGILAWLEKQKEPTTEELYAEAGTTEKEYIANTMKMVRAMREKQKEQKSAEVDVKALLTADRLASAEMTGRLKERSEILENPEKYGLQKPADDKAFEEWIEDWWKHNKVNNPNSYDNGDEVQFDEQGFKNFCRWLRNMYQQKPAEWSEEDKNYYDTIVCTLEVIGDDSGLSNNQIKFLREHCPSHCSEWSEEDENARQNLIAHFEGKILKLSGEAKKEAVDWLKSLRPQPKSEWSEEDETMWSNLIGYLKGKVGMLPSGKERYIKWLKERFVKLVYPKSGWKPSEEQMNGLAHAINLDVYDAKRYGLDSLYNDLKKLM